MEVQRARPSGRRRSGHESAGAALVAQLKYEALPVTSAVYCSYPGRLLNWTSPDGVCVDRRWVTRNA
jgi:hypothetical protein